MKMSKEADALWKSVWEEWKRAGHPLTHTRFMVQQDQRAPAEELKALGYAELRGNGIGGWSYGITEFGADDFESLVKLSDP
jgi:hypothetical protein